MLVEFATMGTSQLFLGGTPSLKTKSYVHSQHTLKTPYIQFYYFCICKIKQLKVQLSMIKIQVPICVQKQIYIHI